MLNHNVFAMKSIITILFSISLALSGFAQHEFRSKLMYEHQDESEPFSSSRTEYHWNTATDIGNPPICNWIKTVGGDGSETVSDIVSDDSGNLYVAGSISGEVDFGDYPVTSIGYRDAFVARFQPDGTLEWIKQIHCDAYEVAEAYALSINASNHIFVTGTFYGNVLHLLSQTKVRTGAQDLFVAEFNDSGELVQSLTYGITDQAFQGKKISADDNGNYAILTGTSTIVLNVSGNMATWSNEAYITDVALFYPNLYLTGYLINGATFGDYTLTTNGISYEPFVAKTGYDFEFAWAIKGDAEVSDYIFKSMSHSIDVDDDENIYIAGKFDDEVSFGGIQLSTFEGYVPFIVKCSNTGNFIWARQGVYSDNFAWNTNYLDPVIVRINPFNEGPFIGCVNPEDFDLLLGDLPAPPHSYYITRYDDSGEANQITIFDVDPIKYTITPDLKIGMAFPISGDLSIELNDLSGISEWAIHTQGKSGDAWISNLEHDQSGNIYLCGYSYQPVPFLNDASGSFLSKINVSGEHQFTIELKGGMLTIHYGQALAIDHNGNIYAIGYFSDTLTIKDHTLVNIDENDAIFFAKFTPAGELDFVKHVSAGTSRLHEYCIATDKSGNILICGGFYGNLQIEDLTFYNYGSEDFFLIKYNTDGDFLWARHAGGEGPEFICFVSTDDQNNIYWIGEYTSRDILIDTYSMPLTDNDGDVILAKFDPEGNLIWAYDYGDDTYNTGVQRWSCWPVAIKTTQDGDSYIYGWTGTANTYGDVVLTSPYENNFSIMKVNNSGQVAWAKIIKQRIWSWHSMDMVVDESGKCYVGGQFRDTIYIEDNMIIPEGKKDLFIAKYGNNGDLCWAKFFGSNPDNKTIYSTSNFLWGIAAIDTSSIVVAGQYTLDLQMDNTILHASNYNGFIALMRYNVGIQPPFYEENPFSIFPNPCDKYVHIQARGITEIKKIEIFTQSGEVIYRCDKPKKDGMIQIETSNLPKGVYLVQITTHSSTFSCKLVRI